MGLQQEFDDVHEEVQNARNDIKDMTVAQDEEDCRDEIVAVLNDCLAGLESICSSSDPNHESLSVPAPRGSTA